MKQADLAMLKWQAETKMKKLIMAALDRFEPDELLELMYDKCLNAAQREDLKTKMIDMTILEDGIFIKTKELGLDRKDKLIDFVHTQIYPSYNEQTANLFAY